MSDLISRQAAIDAMTNYFARWAEYTAWSKTVKAMVETAQEAAREMLKELPSAQPEIIQCKDCIHRYIDGENVRFNVCELNHNKVQSDDWFCADAERQEE